DPRGQPAQGSFPVLRGARLRCVGSGSVSGERRVAPSASRPLRRHAQGALSSPVDDEHGGSAAEIDLGLAVEADLLQAAALPYVEVALGLGASAVLLEHGLHRPRNLEEIEVELGGDALLAEAPEAHRVRDVAPPEGSPVQDELVLEA